jgi:uncharacterized membrane protein
MNFAVRYLAVLAVLALGDALWLSWFGRAVFRPAIGSILLDDPRWSAIVLFYLFYAGGVVVFPVAMGEERGFWLSAALYGALFGFMCYMAYDLTNLATLRAWSVPVAVVDMGWGAFLTALASLAGYAAAKRFDFL